jgi:hypothetical protein
LCGENSPATRAGRAHASMFEKTTLFARPLKKRPIHGLYY